MAARPLFSVALRCLVPCAALLGACTTVGPEHRPPQIVAPQDWDTPHAGSAPADPARLRAWWHAFGDPLLDRLIAQALAGNQDLGIAQARLRQARAERVQIASRRLPTLSVAGQAQAQRPSRAVEPPGDGVVQTYGIGFDASWELDLFGGTQRAIEAADAGIAALAGDRHALQVSLLAELASDYAELRTTQARLAIAYDNVRRLQESERLAERALQHGLGTSAEVAQARAEREAAQAQPPLLEADVRRLGHAIDVLAGGFPGDWSGALEQAAPTLPVAPALPLALPSEVIRQRPDLQAAERRLAAASAQIGVAEAARFPRFSIPLGLGSGAAFLHDLFSGGSLTASAGLHADQLLYDGGRTRAGVDAARAAAEAARLAYERGVRTALREVEDALNGLDAERRRRAALVAAVGDSSLALERATRLYRRGLSGYLPVLEAQRATHQARDALALGEGNEVRSAIALYKALGAGWQDDALPSISGGEGATAAGAIR